MTAKKSDERQRFEQWYATNCFDYVRNPIGSRECGLAWKAWQAALAQPAAAVAWSAEDACEQFIAAEVDSAPEALRRLGDWLCNVLDEDQQKTASRMVIGAMMECSDAIRKVADSKSGRPAPQDSDARDAAKWRPAVVDVLAVMRRLHDRANESVYFSDDDQRDSHAARAATRELYAERDRLAASLADERAILDAIRDAVGGGPYDTIARRIAELIAADKAFNYATAVRIRCDNRITSGDRSDEAFRQQASARHTYDRAVERRTEALAKVGGAS